MTPGLIVNADDWGASEAETEAGARCFAAGTVTSATAMMWMRGSAYAAELASRGEAPALGLHINLTAPFTDPQVPSGVRDRQWRVCAEFERLRRRRVLWSRALQPLVDEAIDDQLKCFTEVYGRLPTHFDGHHHVHLCPNVFRSRSVPAGSLMRSMTVYWPTWRPISAALGFRRRILVGDRVRMPAAFLDLAVFAQEDRDAALERVRAIRRLTELMVHPVRRPEFRFLTAPESSETLRRMPLITYADLDRDAVDPRLCSGVGPAARAGP